MEKYKIERINQLARLAKTRELSQDEKHEQETLRGEYREMFRRNFSATIKNVSIAGTDRAAKDSEKEG